MTDAPDAPPPLPVIDLPPDPLRGAMRDIGPAAMRWFAAVHRRDIIVEATPVELPGGRRNVMFEFRLAKPGLMPSAIERKSFNAFIAGYRAAIDTALSLAEPESSTLRN